MCNCNNGRKMNSCPSFTANAMLVGDYEEAVGSGNHFVERKRGDGMVSAKFQESLCQALAKPFGKTVYLAKKVF